VGVPALNAISHSSRTATLTVVFVKRTPPPANVPPTTPVPATRLCTSVGVPSTISHTHSSLEAVPPSTHNASPFQNGLAAADAKATFSQPAAVLVFALRNQWPIRSMGVYKCLKCVSAPP